MAGRLVVVTGTGTSVGKTHFAEALLRAWRESAKVLGVKPVESGVECEAASDVGRLGSASSFHVKQSLYSFTAALSPHLAARDLGIEIKTAPILALLRDARELAQGVVLELPGGLFSPLAEQVCNAQFAQTVRPDAVLLVAPDRLGVLHDVHSAVRAASTVPLRIDGIVLTAPEHADASTGRNAEELARQGSMPPVLAVLPRATAAELANHPSMQSIVRLCSSAGDPPPPRGAT